MSHCSRIFLTHPQPSKGPLWPQTAIPAGTTTPGRHSKSWTCSFRDSGSPSRDPTGADRKPQRTIGNSVFPRFNFNLFLSYPDLHSFQALGKDFNDITNLLYLCLCQCVYLIPKRSYKQLCSHLLPKHITFSYHLGTFKLVTFSCCSELLLKCWLCHLFIF